MEALNIEKIKQFVNDGNLIYYANLALEQILQLERKGF